MAALHADLGVVVAFGQILRPQLLAATRHGFVNVHFSLLPRWRGAAPVERAVLAGDAETGVWIMEVEEGLDTGGAYAVARTEIGPDETAGELRARLVALGTDLLVQHLPAVPDAVPSPQVGEPVYADKLRPEEFALDPSRTAAELVRVVRAGNPRPGAFTTVDGKRLKVLRAHVATAPAPGGRARSPPPTGCWCSTRSSPRASGPWRPRPGWPAAGRPREPAGDRRTRDGPWSPGRPTRPRAVAIDALVRVEDGAYANLALPALLRRSTLATPERAWVTDAVYGAVRWQRRLDHHLAPASARPLAGLQPVVRAGLRLGMWQVLVAGVPPHAAVDTTVEAVVGLHGGVYCRVRAHAGHEHLPHPEAQAGPHDRLQAGERAGRGRRQVVVEAALPADGAVHGVGDPGLLGGGERRAAQEGRQRQVGVGAVLDADQGVDGDGTRVGWGGPVTTARPAVRRSPPAGSRGTAGGRPARPRPPWPACPRAGPRRTPAARRRRRSSPAARRRS